MRAAPFALAALLATAFLLAGGDGAIVVVAVAASAQASSSKPAAMSKAEYQALMSRSEALNARYGNAVTRLSPQQFKSLYEAVVTGSRRRSSRPSWPAARRSTAATASAQRPVPV